MPQPTPEQRGLRGGLLSTSLPPRSLAGFGAAILAILVIAAFSYRTLRVRHETGERMAETFRVQRQLDSVLSTLQDAETGQRGYLLTGADRYLEPYAIAVGALDRELADARTMLARDPAQLERLNVVDQLAALKMAELKETIELRRGGQLNAALQVVEEDRGRQMMDRIRGVLGELRDSERRRLEERTQAWEDAVTLSTTVSWGGSALLLVLIALAAALSRTRHIPVHVVSATDYTQTALAMGAAGYAIKPVERAQLGEALRRLEAKFTQKLRRVLVVEGDAEHRERTGRLLAGDEVQTVAVGTAAEALEQLRASTFDCMVLELALPDRSGLDLLEEMAHEEQYAFPPVVVYTGGALSRADEQRLRRFSSSIIIKGARSPERLLDEVTLFLHQVESDLPPDRQRMLRDARHREAIFRGGASWSSRTTCATSSRSPACSSPRAPGSRSRATAARRWPTSGSTRASISC
jgi:CHASE3 domain sensor protein